MASHTKGPWAVESWRNGFTGNVAIQGPSPHEHAVPVCWIGANRSSAENEANARLIAASPTLVEALEELARAADVAELMLRETHPAEAQYLAARVAKAVEALSAAR